MADDVVFALPLGELHGKQEVAEYFASAEETIEFKPFERPLEYYAAGDRVVIVGDETWTVRETGATRRTEWAWVFDVRDGVIARIRAIEDLSGIAGEIERAVARARSVAQA
jgi:ketosteroid isomerase-like protein